MSRRKTKFCTLCEMKFMGNHNCISAGKVIKYDDPAMVDVLKNQVRGPDDLEKEPAVPTDGNSGTV